MKAITIFNLPRDRYEHRCATTATEAFRALDEIEKQIRSKLKYSQDLSDSARAELEVIRSMLPHREMQWVSE